MYILSFKNTVYGFKFVRLWTRQPHFLKSIPSPNAFFCPLIADSNSASTTGPVGWNVMKVFRHVLKALVIPRPVARILTRMSYILIHHLSFRQKRKPAKYHNIITSAPIIKMVRGLELSRVVKGCYYALYFESCNAELCLQILDQSIICRLNYICLYTRAAEIND